MIAMASAMMVRIAPVAVGRHLIGIAGCMTFRDLLIARITNADACVRPLQGVRRRRRSKGEDERQAGKDGQQASHRSSTSSNVEVGIVFRMARSYRADRKVLVRAVATRPAALVAPIRPLPADGRRIDRSITFERVALE